MGSIILNYNCSWVILHWLFVDCVFRPFPRLTRFILRNIFNTSLQQMLSRNKWSLCVGIKRKWFCSPNEEKTTYLRLPGQSLNSDYSFDNADVHMICQLHRFPLSSLTKPSFLAQASSSSKLKKYCCLGITRKQCVLNMVHIIDNRGPLKNTSLKRVSEKNNTDFFYILDNSGIQQSL